MSYEHIKRLSKDQLIERIYTVAKHSLNANGFRIDKTYPEDVTQNMMMYLVKYKSKEALLDLFFQDTGKINFGRLRKIQWQSWYSEEGRTAIEYSSNDMPEIPYRIHSDIYIPDWCPLKVHKLAHLLSKGYTKYDIDIEDYDDTLKYLKKVVKGTKKRKSELKKRGRKDTFDVVRARDLRNKGLSYREISKLVGVSHIAVYNRLKA